MNSTRVVKKKRVSYTPKTIERLKEDGWPIVVNVERWNQYARVMQDLLGFIDVWAYHPGRGHLFVQVTSRGNISTRIKKIIDEHGDDAKLLVGVDYNRVVVHGWDKKDYRWRLEERDITEQIKTGTDSGN